MSDRASAVRPTRTAASPVELPGLHGPVPAAGRTDPGAEGRRLRRRASSTVTDGYLAHAKEAEGWNLEEATWFLAICAVLLELKVGRLMPTPHRAGRGGPARRLARSGVRAVAGARRVPQGRGGDRAAPGGRGGLLRPRRRARARSSRTCTPIRWSASSAGAARRGRRAAAAAAPDPRPLARDAGPLHGGRGDDDRARSGCDLDRPGRHVPRAGRRLRGADPRGGAVPGDPGAVP